jgi:hypothetical protein
MLFPIFRALKSQTSSSGNQHPNLKPTDFIEHAMLQGPLLDQTGRLLPIENKYLNVPSKANRVDECGRMYDRTLLSEVKKGANDIELFMELHRRVTQKYRKSGTRYPWDTASISGEYQNQNAVMVSKYDRKWKIIQRGGLTYMPQGRVQ